VADDTARTDGWMAEKPLHVRVYHYIRDTRALCGRYGFTGELVPDVLSLVKGREDCSECFKRLRKAKEAKRGG